MSSTTAGPSLHYDNGFVIRGQDSDSETSPVEISDAQENFQRLRFLVADDNGVNRRIAAIQLEHQGHFVRTAVDGQEALAILEEERFDCVLMDVQMPGIDGLEATRRIRQREQLAGGHLPVIAMTADALPEDRTRCRGAGMDDIMIKPLDPREAVKAALHLIETRQAGTAARPAPNF